MNRFYQIPTDTYTPISHERRYLFDQYDKIANFLANNLDGNYKSILAKPVQSGKMVDWFSVYENLADVRSGGSSGQGVDKYWQFHAKISDKIAQLASSADDNKKDWAEILSKVFEHKNNFVFSNGQDISIVWGWKFDNYELRRPLLEFGENNLPIAGEIHPLPPSDEVEPVQPISSNRDEAVPEDQLPEEIKPIEQERIVEEVADVHEEVEPVSIKQDSDFKGFLKWFASNFWWLLLALLLFIIISLLFNSCNQSDVNKKLQALEDKANKCCP